MNKKRHHCLVCAFEYLLSLSKYVHRFASVLCLKMNSIVWEWKLNVNIWVPYGPEVSCLLEKSCQDKKDIVDLGKAEPSLSCYEVSLKSMTQTRLETGRSVVRCYFDSVFMISIKSFQDIILIYKLLLKSNSLSLWMQ